MTPISKEELARRKARLGEDARAELVKSGIVQFRVEPAVLEELCDLSDVKRMRMGGMVREWVLDRLKKERAGYEGLSLKEKKSGLAEKGSAYESSSDLRRAYEDMSQRLFKLETIVTQLASAKATGRKTRKR